MNALAQTEQATPVTAESDSYRLLVDTLTRHPNRELTITPSMAEELLEKHNLHNRPVRQSIVDRYASDMKNGRWAVNGETVKFDRHGVLADGQHRLFACFEAETAFSTYVVVNVSDNAFETIDIGLKRSPSDSLAVAGMENNSALAAPAIRVIIAYGRKAEGVAMNVAQISNAEVVEFWKKNPGINHVCDYVSKVKPSLKRLVPPSSLVSLIYFVVKAGYDEDKIHEFCVKLETGVDLSEQHPILTLRNKLSDRATKRSREDVYEVLIWCVRAFNAWTRGSKLATIYGSNTSTRGDSYPAIKPPK